MHVLIKTQKLFRRNSRSCLQTWLLSHWVSYRVWKIQAGRWCNALFWAYSKYKVGPLSMGCRAWGQVHSFFIDRDSPLNWWICEQGFACPVQGCHYEGVGGFKWNRSGSCLLPKQAVFKQIKSCLSVFFFQSRFLVLEVWRKGCPSRRKPF
jgi:hypothetical protein